MNAPQFMAYVAYQQRVSETRIALRDAQNLWVHGPLSHVLGTEQEMKLRQEWGNRMEALEEEHACALDRLGLTTPGLPR